MCQYSVQASAMHTSPACAMPWLHWKASDDDKPRLKYISLGPPRELIACEGAFQLQTVSFSADCMAALTAMIATLSSLDLVVVYGLSPEQTEALRAAVPADMEVDTSGEACLRLSSTSM